MRLDEIFAGQRGHAFLRPVEGGRIGVISERERIESAACDVIGVLQAGLDVGQYLPPHPFDGVCIEARLLQRCLEQLHCFFAVLCQETSGDGQGVIAHVETKTRCQRFLSAGEGAGIHIGGPLFEQGSHQVDCPPLARRVQRCTAANTQLKGNEGDGMILDQPSRDPAGTGDFLNVDFGPQRQGSEKA